MELSVLEYTSLSIVSLDLSVLSAINKTLLLLSISSTLYNSLILIKDFGLTKPLSDNVFIL